MSGGKQSIDQIEIDYRDKQTGNIITAYVDVYDSSLSRKWLTALNHLIKHNYHLEKNFCFLGWVESQRNIDYLLDQINQSIAAVNNANLGYYIDDHFERNNTIESGPIADGLPGGKIIHEKFNHLHRYFEDLQGVSGKISPYYQRANDEIRWHIRQLNLLCHEFESLVISVRKDAYLPEWRRPSQLMCWLNAPRFILDEEDFELFGIETINRPLGGVFVGVNKAVGKHHWEVFNDEGRSVDELITTTMRSQTEAAGDFDIEWANNPGNYQWQQDVLKKFRVWLIDNGFDPDDKSLTIGHPQVGQIDLQRSFNSDNYQDIWKLLGTHLDVAAIRTGDVTATYEYHWSDTDYMNRQIERIRRGE